MTAVLYVPGSQWVWCRLFCHTSRESKLVTDSGSVQPEAKSAFIMGLPLNVALG